MFFFNVPDEYIQKTTENLAAKYGVDPERIVLHQDQQGSSLKWTLLHTVDEMPAGAQDAPYPFEFIKDYERLLASKQRRIWQRRMGGKFEFIDGGRITSQEIERRQSAFSAHCDLFHLND